MGGSSHQGGFCLLWVQTLMLFNIVLECEPAYAPAELRSQELWLLQISVGNLKCGKSLKRRGQADLPISGTEHDDKILFSHTLFLLGTLMITCGYPAYSCVEWGTSDVSLSNCDSSMKAMRAECWGQAGLAGGSNQLHATANRTYMRTGLCQLMLVACIRTVRFVAG